MSTGERLGVVPVVLAGGSGTRVSALSRSLHRKQYLSLGVGKRKESASKDAHPIVLETPADHEIAGDSAFTAALRGAVKSAVGGGMVVLGIRPQPRDTGHGHVLHASVWRDALQRFRGDVSAACDSADATATPATAFLRLDTKAFAAIRADSIDDAVTAPANRPAAAIEIRIVSFAYGRATGPKEKQR